MTTYILEGKEVNIWSKELAYFHSRSVVDYVRDNLLKFEEIGVDPFSEIVGNDVEKELVKNALMSGSSIIFRGKKGYGKTTFAKAISKLLPEKILAVKGCKINDDPVNPVCFSCKKKVEDGVVELEWVKPKFVRICGDPMMTTRQLIGGISLQKLREGYDLDSPEVFTPGKILKANRGIAYVDELGAIPSALQTLLHELLEEKQVTTPEGDIVPMKIDVIFIASTNPANYKGVSDIKEPLLDRMEVVEIRPPDSLEKEIEIAIRNTNKWLRESVIMPEWHAKTLARVTILARNKETRLPEKIEVEPSCRATIKIFDHVMASAVRKGHRAVMISDYGCGGIYDFSNILLGLRGRMKLEFRDDKLEDVVNTLVNDALEITCSELFSIMQTEISRLASELGRRGEINVYEDFTEFEHLLPEAGKDSALEFMLETLARCVEVAERIGDGVYAYSTLD
ncbi:MAG: ATPase [Archaeoglobus sp.]|jgi:magnesium chelatase subunit I|nr:MAG: ATPase [Archaeoglobus sp.]